MNRGMAALAAPSLLACALGSLHAFSVLLEPLERELGIGRAQASLFYSIAIVCLALGMLAGPRLYRRIAPARLALLVGALAAAGLALAAAGTTPLIVAVGYGALFGLANGVGYGLCLQRAALALPERSGLATGVVTAAYAGGAVVFAKLLALLAASGGAALAFGVHAALLAAAGGLAAIGMPRAATAEPAVMSAIKSVPISGRVFGLLWFGYFLGAMTGLMVIGHAGGIVAAAGGAASQIALGAMLIAAGNAAGALAAGWLADRAPLRLVLAAAAILSAVAAGLLAASPSPAPVIAALAVAGFAYGALIALYPVAALAYFGAQRAAAIFARIFIAWGAAGLLGPWLAGLLFDSTGEYVAALGCAAGAGAVAAILSLLLPSTPANAPRSML